MVYKIPPVGWGGGGAKLLVAHGLLYLVLKQCAFHKQDKRRHIRSWNLSYVHKNDLQTSEI